MAIKIFKRLGYAGRGDNPHTQNEGSLPPPSPSDAFSFPKPVPANRAAPKLTADEGKAFKIGPSLQRYHIDPNKKGLIITHHSSNLPPHDSSGRMNLTSPPPANWPTEHQLTMHRIKTQLRSGTNPSDVDVSAIRAGIQKERDSK